MRQHALLAAVFLCLGGMARAADTTVERYVELRDGSVLRLQVVDEPWKVKVLRAEGQIEEVHLRLADIKRLTLTPEPVFAKKRAVLDAVKKLGSDEFAEREQANRDLLKMGPAIRSDLIAVQDLYTDPEIKSRLRDILNEWAEAKAAPSGLAFDMLHAKDVILGDAGEVAIPVRVDGKVYRLARKEVLGLSTKPPDVAQFDLARVGGGLRRLQPNDFPKGCVEEGFESAPDGRKLRVGENIERLFISKGFLLSTSVKTSHVSVNDFMVQGKSRGLSAATHLPLFTGEITVTFVKPGHEDIPAGVTYFGLWIAWIEPNGTALHAYDLNGREIGSIKTTRSGHEFLGISSPVPIHKIRVVPNLQIDPDYTLDDFIYTPPETADAGDPERCKVHLTTGERLLCKEVTCTPEGVHLQGLSAGLPDRTCPLVEVLRLIAPDKGKKEPATPPGVFVELADGSLLFGAKPVKGAVPVFSQRPQVLKDQDRIVGLWGTASPRIFWHATAQKLPIVGKLDESRQTVWQMVDDVKLGEDSVQWNVRGGPKVTQSYFELSPLLLHLPTGAGGPGSWHLRTRQGDDMVLSTGALPRISGKLTGAITTTWEGKELKLTAETLLSIYRVPKAP